MISDFIKGKKQYEYPPGIRRGIVLHRMIDRFTDAHGATIAAKEFFRKDYRLYSGAFVDVCFDHFLAADESIFDEQSLQNFSGSVYQKLEKQKQHLPPLFSGMFPYMKRHDWLSGYRHESGIRSGFGGLARRASYITDSETAFRIFLKNYEGIKDCYNLIFPELKEFAAASFEKLMNISDEKLYFPLQEW